MAIIPEGSTTTGELRVAISNGDYRLLKESTERLKFKDEGSLLRYAIAVLSKSATRGVTVINANGQPEPLAPADALLKDAQTNQ